MENLPDLATAIQTLPCLWQAAITVAVASGAEELLTARHLGVRRRLEIH